MANNKEKEFYSFGFGRKEIDELFVLQFEEMGFKDIDLKEVRYNIRLKTIIEDGELIVTPELISATADFEAEKGWERKMNYED